MIHDCGVQVWAESVPAAPEKKGCAAVLEKDMDQRQPEGTHERADAQSTQPQQTGQQQSQEALRRVGEGAADAVAPHPLLSVAPPSQQEPERSDSNASASAHPLMQVIACCACWGLYAYDPAEGPVWQGLCQAQFQSQDSQYHGLQLSVPQAG